MKRYWYVFSIAIITINFAMYFNSVILNDNRRFISSNPLLKIFAKIELYKTNCNKINNYIFIKLKYSFLDRDIDDLNYLKACNIKEFNFIKNYEDIKISEMEYIFLVYKYIYYLDIKQVKLNIIKNKYESKEAKKILMMDE